MTGGFEHSNKISGSIKRGEFREELRKVSLSSKESLIRGGTNNRG